MRSAPLTASRVLRPAGAAAGLRSLALPPLRQRAVLQPAHSTLISRAACSCHRHINFGGQALRRGWQVSANWRRCRSLCSLKFSAAAMLILG